MVSKESGIPETYIEEEIWCTVGFKLSKAEMIDRERRTSRGSDECCYGCVLMQHDSWYKNDHVDCTMGIAYPGNDPGELKPNDTAV